MSMNQMFQPTLGIYALGDPTTDRVMYVGQSIDTDYRFRTHRTQIHSNRKLGEWLGDLKRHGFEPKQQILERCRSDTELDAAEKKWIRHYKALGQAELNISVGGSTRSTSKVLNTNPDDWWQFAMKVRDAHSLLLEIQGDSLQLSSVKHFDSMRDLLLKWERVIRKMEQELREKFPE